MGERGNIAILQRNNQQVWLYSHWGGHDLPENVKQGLKAGKGRWSDESYLARIIVSNAIPADGHKQETGYGLSCQMQDNEYPITVVDIPNQRVYKIEETELDEYRVPKDYEPKKTWSFSEYVGLPEVVETE